ncbi:hypothetical protein [Alloactinosynnema sp. L-07]|uniref:hypothetical protein n=1 Tax=Alloactinosynnema sp. L-07 TaxID=1653480 RepID=UPI00065EF5A3|nr:hypothetical protein [Alloactinosynnema sp. L-07]CRK61353.1 hypothetical protein [Alloactinosynnema sp. L-07]
MSTEPEDPLDRVTLSPARFAATLAVIALLLGLILALIPVRVASPNAAAPGKVSCGNTIGGVETRSVVEGLGANDRPVTVAYIDMCERAISGRTTVSWLLFFAGLVGGIGLGVVRKRR